MKLPEAVFLHTSNNELLTQFYLQYHVKVVNNQSILQSNQASIYLITDQKEDLEMNCKAKIIFIANNDYLTKEQFDQVNIMVPDYEALFKLYKEPELVLFDMDGLLVDTEYLCLEPFRKAHEYYGYSISDETLQQLIGTSGVVLEQILRDTYDHQYPFEKIITLANRLTLEEIKRNLPVKQGSFTLLNYYKERQIPCIVASSSSREMIELYITQAHMENYFKEIACLDDVNKSKPAPDIFLAGCHKMNLEPKDCLVYEDSKNGIIAANLAGIPVVCIPDLVYHDQAIFKQTLGFGKSLNEFT